MKSSPKANEVPLSTESKTPASGKKLVQARLPFKTLGGSVPPFSTTNDTSDTSSLATAAADNRKRRQNDDDDDKIRAAKLNRSDFKSGGNISLEANEILEISSDVPAGNDATTGSKLMKVDHTSESKENVCVVKGDADEIAENGDRSGTDDEDATHEPKAKQSLDFEKKHTESRKSKRTSESSLIKIKLPMSKKSKELAKKHKKHKKTDDVQNEMEIDEAEEKKPDETPVTDEKTKEDKQPEAENNMEVDATSVLTEQEVREQSKSNSDDDEGNVLNDSVVSNPAEQCATPTNHKLTPKQMQRRVESEKKKQEKEQARLERERKLQEEKEMRQREKEEKELQKKREREEKGTLTLTH